MTSLKQIHEQFDTQDKCMAFLVSIRWPEGVCCVRCGNPRVYKLKRPWCWQCKVCQKNGYRFSALVGTIFENTNYPLPIWFEVIYLICQSKKGMSALQIQRMLRDNGRPTAYKTAFFICHRVRAMLDNPEFPPLMGVVEVDETGLGGKDKNRHWDKKQHITGMSGKATVIGAIARKGNVVCQVIDNIDTPTAGSLRAQSRE